MARLETAETIARNMTVTAEGILNNRADLGSYPHRHLCVVGGRPADMGRLLAVVEHLSHWGWELVNVTSFGESSTVHAFLRRPQPTQSRP
ncbi:hypothetical protein KRM28CT15_65940 [Krasilnikovia sp. M28-CT-15]